MKTKEKTVVSVDASEPETVMVTFGGQGYTAKTYLSLSKRVSIVDSIVDAMPTEGGYLSQMMAYSLLHVYYLKATCPDFPLPLDDNGNIDIDAACELVETAWLCDRINVSMFNETAKALEDRVEFENKKALARYGTSFATEDVLDTVSDFCHGLVRLTEKAGNAVDEVADLLKQSKAKILKNITAKRINSILDTVKQQLPGLFADDDPMADNVTKMPVREKGE